MKLWSPKQHAPSVRGSLELAERFERNVSADGPFCSLSLWDNSAFPSKAVGLDEFRRLSTLTAAEAEEHLKRRKDKARQRLAGQALTRLSTFGSDVKLSMMLANHHSRERHGDGAGQMPAHALLPSASSTGAPWTVEDAKRHGQTVAEAVQRAINTAFTACATDPVGYVAEFLLSERRSAT
jgi:hypothetical protein